MKRRPARGRDDYFDVKLVELLIALFDSAARAEDDGGVLVFPKGGNNRYRPGRVREAFGITEDDFSNWKYQNWDKAGVDRPVGFEDALIGVFDEAVFAEQHPKGVLYDDRAKKIQAARNHWRTFHPLEIETALAGLRAHREQLVRERAEKPLRRQQKLSAVADGAADDAVAPLTPASASALSYPPDLSPPPCPTNVSRPRHRAALHALAQEYFGVVIEGRPKSGKRYVARDYVAAHAAEMRVLWFNLTADSVLKDVLVRFEAVEPPLVAPAGQATSSLIGWLRHNSTLLVLDGLDDANRHSFAPLLQLAASIPGPCHLLVIASVRSDGANAHDIGALTFEEATAILDTLTIPYDRDDVRAAAGAGTLSPFVLRQAATLFGSVNSRHLAAPTNALHAELVAQLAPDLRPAIEVLQVINAEFDLEVLAVVLNELKVDQTPGQVLRDLERLLLAKPASAETWKLEAGKSEFASIYLPLERLREVLVGLAYHYRSKVVRDGRLPKDPSFVDAMQLFAACRLLQLANANEFERERLRACFATTLERHGAFSQLALLYQFEISNGEKRDQWLAFRYARALFVLGLYDRAIDVVADVIDRIFRDTDDRDEDLYLCCCRLVAEILVESGRPDIAVKLLDGALDCADVANLGGTVCVQAVSALSWSLAKAHMSQACIDLSDDVLDKQFEGLTHPFSRQVSNVRIGVAFRELGEGGKSVQALASACAYFSERDARAYAWAAAQLALSWRALGNIAEAQRALQSAIETNASYNFFNGDLAAIYQTFAAEPAYSPLHAALYEEMERIASLEHQRLALTDTLCRSRLVKHLMLDLEVDPEAAFVFDIEKYKLFSLSSPPPMASKFSQHLVARLREANIEEILDSIFATKTPTVIFRSHLYNRVITVACKDVPILAKKFVYPHVETIATESDSIIFLYARYFEAVGHPDAAERLLSNVRNKEVFNYYNIKANCAAHSNPEHALELNDEAFRLAYSRQRRAQILHNKASIVYNSDMRAMFVEAKEWCEQSVRLATKPKFVWPKNLLLKLALANCDHDEIEDVVRAHQARFRAPPSVLARIVRDVKNRRVREAALEAVGRLD